MNDIKSEMVHKINHLSNDLDSIYHSAARLLGVNDSILFVLYTLYEKGDGCLLQDVCRESYISKQTVNSAIRKLEQDGIIFLEQYKGKAKKVRITPIGQEYISKTAKRLFEAECGAFKDWSQEQLMTYLSLSQKYNQALRLEIEKL